MRNLALALVAAALGGCAKASTMPITNNMVMITSSAATICGRAGSQSVAVREAAVETIRRGFDRFVILDGRYANNVAVVGRTSIIANTGVDGTTYIHGGQPIVAGTHDQGVIVKMFTASGPAAANAVDARQQLGPKWRDEIKRKTATC